MRLNMRPNVLLFITQTFLSSICLAYMPVYNILYVRSEQFVDSAPYKLLYVFFHQTFHLVIYLGIFIHQGFNPP